MSNQHAEWLNLVPHSGPFLTEPVLNQAFEQGLEKLDPIKKKILRQAYEEWREAIETEDHEFEQLHQAWVKYVLELALELDEEILKSGEQLPEELKYELSEYDITLKPDYAVVDDQHGDKPMLLIHIYDHNVQLEETIQNDGWATTPAERMVHLCKATNTRLGLVSNGEHWLLVDAPEAGVTTFASWYSRLWSQEPITLQAFIALLGVARYFCEEERKLPHLIDESAKHQDDVTETLGEQVRRAVEVLIQALDKADIDRNRELLKEVQPAELYEAALTIMMRLVFLLSAEERDLLLLGDERYESNYAISTLRQQLRDDAHRYSEEVLDHRYDAWSRLLSMFRAVYGGIEHETLRLPALGGSLFDPDRFPFLEGRNKGSNWQKDAAIPLPIDNRTVLFLLEAIQLYRGRTLSYRALDVEQIGYVYEGLLERTAVRVKDITLELSGTKNAKQPWVTLVELESAKLDSASAVEKLLKERTGSAITRVRNDLNKNIEDAESDKLLSICRGDQALRDRIKPYFHLLQIDRWGYPLVYPKDAFMVATGTGRRETGTHYTPKSLTESIVKDTLEPVVYIGPAEGKERKDWKLKSSAELLDLKICDLAMGSGAFLVQVCRWLSERLLEAWSQAETQGKSITVDGIAVDEIASQELISSDAEERSVTARRLIAERCLYGVDINPLAVELAKLSIWLVTLAKGRPFGFLDHNLRHGDSLLGITNMDQLYYLDMKVGKGSAKMLFAQKIDEAVKKAIELRLELRQRPIRDIHDVEVMTHLDQQAREKLKLIELVANVLVGEALKVGGKRVDMAMLSIEAGQAFDGDKEAFEVLKRRAKFSLNTELPEGKQSRKTLHWCLEFPEVFLGEKQGFDAIVGNPPFLGNTSIRGAYGKNYRDFLTEILADGRSGKADLVVFFFLKSFELINEGGFFGLVATSSISEGESKEVGIRYILGNGGVIYSAIPMLKWPGSASVVVSVVHVEKGVWEGKKLLFGNEVNYISENLTQGERWLPVKLQINRGLVFKGTEPNGEGFVIESSLAERLILEEEKNQKVLSPYLIAKDVNQTPLQSSDRWIINFWDWSEKKSREYTSIFEIVERNMKHIRQRTKSNGEYVLGKSLAEKWWLLKRTRPDLYHKIGRGASFDHQPKEWRYDIPHERVIVFARGATKFPSFTYIENGQIFGDSLCVIVCESAALFSVLSSDMHAVWAWEFGGRKTHDLRYIQDDVFETFPFPDSVLDDSHKQLRDLGEQYFNHRSEYMRSHNKGMTKFYNDLHNQCVTTEEIQILRKLKVEINDEVMLAYGFEDIDPEYGFHEVGYLPEGKNSRFTISETVREEVLYRLAMLNKERYEMEISKIVKIKPTTKYKKSTSRKYLKVAENYPDLFEDNE